MDENDPIKERIIDLCEGNPGALTVLIQMVQAAQVMGQTYTLPFLFDYMKEQGLTGPEIWILFKDECDEDFSLFLQTLSLRAETNAITAEAANG